MYLTGIIHQIVARTRKVGLREALTAFTQEVGSKRCLLSPWRGEAQHLSPKKPAQIVHEDISPLTALPARGQLLRPQAACVLDTSCPRAVGEGRCEPRMRLNVLHCLVLSVWAAKNQTRQVDSSPLQEAGRKPSWFWGYNLNRQSHPRVHRVPRPWRCISGHCPGRTRA